MSSQVKSEEAISAKESVMVVCYLCETELPKDKSFEIPLTTGGTVRVHPSCFEFYMSQSQAAAACNSCSGDLGCCG